MGSGFSEGLKSAYHVSDGGLYGTQEGARMRRSALPCRAVEVAGILRHSHFRNRLLAALSAGPHALGVIYGDGDSARRELETLLDELIDLLGKPEDGFSPVLLLDQLEPLRGLDDAARKRLRSSMVERYRREFEPERRAAELRDLVGQMRLRMGRLLEAETASREAIESARESVLAVYRAISELPGGIWFSPAEGTA